MVKAELNPQTLVEIIDRAEALAATGNVDAAIDAYRGWLAANDSPAAFAAHFNLTVLYFKKQQTGLAQAALRACLRCNPGFETAKNLCIDPTMDQRRPMAARASYGHDRLKVVWLGHSSVFERPNVKTVLAGFSASGMEHAVWAWGPKLPPGALDISTLSDEAVACNIRTQEADVLVDLMAWTEHCRPAIVSYHPAPTVAFWTESPQPTGLHAMDAVIADEGSLPLDAEKAFAETVLRLGDAHSNASDPAHGLLPQIEALLLKCDRRLPVRTPNPVPGHAELEYLKAPGIRGRRYVIVAPPYQHASAGIRVLYDLQKWLVLAGFDAMVCTWFPGYPIDSFADDIVIYPEVAPGNLLQSKRVVRYILNTPGKLGHGEKAYAPDELLVAYNSELAPYADGHVLQLPSTEPFFRNDRCERNKDAMYVGKGRNLGLHPVGCVEITKQFPPTRKQMAEFLQTVRTLYTYDDFTMLGHEAKLCGCNVTLIDGSGQMKPLQTSYVPSLNEFRAQLHHFINLTQQM